MLDLKWVVVTPDRLPEGDKWVIIGLDPRQYESASKNQTELYRWIKEAMWRLNQCRGTP